MLRIVRVTDPAHLKVAAQLIREYSTSLPISLDFEGIGDEVDHLPGEYGPPAGCLLLAYVDDQAAGCVALRKWDSGICEMKRLFVRVPYRGLGIGRKLCKALMSEALRLGYRCMRLDTLPFMHEARDLYVKLGFREIPPYATSPVPETICMEIDLGENMPPAEDRVNFANENNAMTGPCSRA